jgi:hypothetical protein
MGVPALKLYIDTPYKIPYRWISYMNTTLTSQMHRHHHHHGPTPRLLWCV